jgi:hypothetical protein
VKKKRDTGSGIRRKTTKPPQRGLIFYGLRFEMEPPDGEARVPSTMPQDSIKPALTTKRDDRKWAKDRG